MQRVVKCVSIIRFHLLIKIVNLVYNLIRISNIYTGTIKNNIFCFSYKFLITN